MINEYAAGWVKTVQNLDFLVVYNSGHLVPCNDPVQVLDQEFGDVVIPVVFDPSVLDGESTWKATATSSVQSFFLRLPCHRLLGFCFGAVMVFFCLKRTGGGGCAKNRHQNEPIKNVSADNA